MVFDFMLGLVYNLTIWFPLKNLSPLGGSYYELPPKFHTFKAGGNVKKEKLDIILWDAFCTEMEIFYGPF